MTREEFEELVGAWLAEPEREDLRRRVEAAVRSEPELASELAAWQRCEELLRCGCPVPPEVDWARVKARILAAVEQDAADSDCALDAVLRELPPVDERVHWPRVHARVMAALTRDAVAASRRRRYTRVAAGAATLLAAAAALFLAVLPGETPGPAADGSVQVRLCGPPPDVAGVAYAHIGGAPPSAAPPERFFVVDPMPKTGPSPEAAGYY